MRRLSTRFGSTRWVAGALLACALGVCHGDPLILFSPGSERDLSNRQGLLLPNGGHANLELIAGRCKPGRGGDLRAYDLATGQCDGMSAIGPPAFHQPRLDQPLQGSALTGQPVQDALDAGLLVWYDLSTSRACVVGSCNPVFGSIQTVTIDTFAATPDAIIAGNQTSLSWTTSAANSCTLGDDQGGLTVSVVLNGGVSRTPLVTTVYTLSCQGNNGPATSDATVTVTGPLPEDIFADGFES